MTAQQLFDKALDLLGLRKTDGGHTADISDLEQRALTLINIVVAENSELDCRIRRCEFDFHFITDFDKLIDCSKIIGNSVLPYGLAHLLMVGEDDALAEKFLRLYNDARARAIRYGHARRHQIEEVY